MARIISIGAQRYDDLRTNGYFYVDKTSFLRDWWHAADQVTLVCRPRRFGKTLMLDAARCFLSLEFAGRGEELFGGLDVWRDSTMRALQGTVPVVSLSFARCKGATLADSIAAMKQVIRVAVDAHAYLLSSSKVTDADRALLERVADNMDDATATSCLGQLCSMLHRHHGVRPVILLDEYDTPMQEAWLGGWWDAMASFVRTLFNATFKTNPALGRGLITGVTRVASESIFSDLNNPEVVTVTTPKYATAFGFTQEEVDAALKEYGRVSMRDEVRRWYDGFTFGGVAGVYNPWSITGFLDSGEVDSYWANSSTNALVDKLVRTSGPRFKEDFETLLSGGAVRRRVDERVDFRRLESSPDAVWSLLLATGYLRAERLPGAGGRRQMDLSLTNEEVRETFDVMVCDWFQDGYESYGDFCRSLLAGDLESVNHYLGEICRACMSSFDAGTGPSQRGTPERFYHGLVLGLLVELRGRYCVQSNRESGLGRYDVVLEPLDGPEGHDPAFVIEFKLLDKTREADLHHTARRALEQIGEKGYATTLVERGFAPDRIRLLGFAFCGKKVLVASGE